MSFLSSRNILLLPISAQHTSKRGAAIPSDEQNQLLDTMPYDTFFDGQMPSNLTIHLSDRTVHVRRAVLCRASKHFAELCREKEGGVKEIQLRDDDPSAMVSLLRSLYSLSYTQDATIQWATSLQPHAMVLVAAEKYQIEALKEEVCHQMQRIISSAGYLELERNPKHPLGGRLKNTGDYVGALRTILAGTPPQDPTTGETDGRKLLINFLIQNLEMFRMEDELLSLLIESPNLGAEIIGHRDLECEAHGRWFCGHYHCADSVPSCKKCSKDFERGFMRRHRYDQRWECSMCKTSDEPICKNCKSWIVWHQFDEVPPRLSKPVGE
jgi:hypothetical protein